MSPLPPIVLITGPTASGKTQLSIELSNAFQIPIICGDSQQLYTECPIFTAAPTPDELRSAQHLLFQSRSVENPVTVSKWYDAVSEVLRGEKQGLICGGSVKYCESIINPAGVLSRPVSVHDSDLDIVSCDSVEAGKLLWQQLPPDQQKRVVPNDYRRVRRLLADYRDVLDGKTPLSPSPAPAPPAPPVLLIRTVPPPDHEERIHERISLMLEAGLLEEVVSLRKRELSYSELPRGSIWRSVGYRELVEIADKVIAGQKVDEAELSLACQSIARNTLKLARTQTTALAHMGGLPVQVWDRESVTNIVEYARSWLQNPVRIDYTGNTSSTAKTYDDGLVKCECGAEVQKSSMNLHRKSRRHRRMMKCRNRSAGRKQSDELSTD